MDVRFVWTARNADKGRISLVSRHPVEDLPDLLARTDGLVWVDIPSWDDEAKRVLTDVFCFHPLAIRDCMERNQVPKVHVYPGHVFLVLHAPFGGKAGHVHYIELDQFVGENFLVTVHGPLNPAVDPEVARVEVLVIAAPARGGPAAPEGRLRAVPRHGVRAHRAAAELHGAPDPGRLETRTDASPAGISVIRRSSWTRLFRARHGLLTVRDDGVAEPGGLRADGQDRGVRTGARRVPDRGHRRPVRPAAGDGARPEGVPGRAPSSSTRREPTPR